MNIAKMANSCNFDRLFSERSSTSMSGLMSGLTHPMALTVQESTSFASSLSDVQIWTMLKSGESYARLIEFLSSRYLAGET